MLKQLYGLVTPPGTMRYSLPLVSIILVAAAVAISLNLALAQSANGVYDTDGDRLIEISNLEQLDAVRHDSDGNGLPDPNSDGSAYGEAFPTGANQSVCESACNGYELEHSLDFSSADSYASGRVNPAWTGGAGWTPIAGFRAILNGNGLTISNLYISGQVDTGLFGVTPGATRSAGSATIRNIGLLDVEVTGRDSVGALVGSNYGTVAGSYSTGRVTGTGVRIGGLVGDNNGTVTNSHSDAAVRGSSGSEVGGLVGKNGTRRTVSLSYSTGAVTGHSGVGGLVGHNASGTIIESYSKSEVTGSGNDIGGLVGHSSGSVNVSYATGAVSGSNHVGGLIGLSNGTSITSVYATGTVFGHDRVGGLIGRIISGTISSSYAVGSVSGTTRVGGLVGLEARGTIARSYWNTTTSGLTASGGGEGATTAELQEPIGNTGIYAGWNPRQWDFGSSSQYPALRADMDGDGEATAAEFGGQGRTPPTPPPTPTHTPTPTLPPQAYVDFSMGLGHICLLRDDGVVECSGDNSHGQATPPEGGRYVKLDGGDNHTCGLSEDGEVDCWGSVAGTFSKDNPPVPPTPTPTPTPTPPPGPTTGPPATVGPTPPGSDSCMETLSANGSVTGEWASGCQSETEAQDDSGSYPFARYYSFTLAEESEVTITLELASGDADTYLYLRDGDARSGDFLYENDDDGGTTRSEIVATLGAGSYTIEATTYEAGQTGTFTLTVSGL